MRMPLVGKRLDLAVDNRATCRAAFLFGLFRVVVAAPVLGPVRLDTVAVVNEPAHHQAVGGPWRSQKRQVAI